MPLTAELNKVLDALEDAHDKSKRDGKWCNVMEVKRFHEGATAGKLRQLVKKHDAIEKKVSGKKTRLFKPTRSGGGSGLKDIFGNRGSGYEPPRGDGYRSPDGGDRVTAPDSGRLATDTVARGIATAIIGGSAGVTSNVPTVTR